MSRTVYKDCEYWHNDKGERHRKDGPAIVSGGYKAWFINDECIYSLHKGEGEIAYGIDISADYIPDSIRQSIIAETLKYE
jgi:hypothetical protein